MVNENINELKSLASRFRVAIIDAAKKDNLKTLSHLFDNFPRGCCKDTCILLGQYLKEQGHGDFKYVHANRKNESREDVYHSWLKRGNFIIDITADQFKDVHEPVIVGEEHPLHKSFTIINEEHDANLGIYDSPNEPILRAMYATVLRNLP